MVQEMRFLICYSPDGTVRTLYKGAFDEGQFDDKSGLAWEIAKEDTSNKYYYYKGTFKNGVRPKHDISQKPLSKEEIMDIIESNELELDIRWSE
ncbi:hypothetical protein [Butyrivibrio sp. AC2005]|uniref:hypothetical protein n=1 Tax=Butyrivibrio sp. AC2005 TaxID=1280672 RepID=UPI00041B5655|nr:hypothetical protein [Butyrivibrio sp. AC2005]